MMRNEKENREERTNMVRRERYLPVDKGYAWVILTATFSIVAINKGTDKASGLFFIEYLDTFQRSVSNTALAGSLIDVVSFITTILVLIVALKKLSVRTCVFIGLILCAIGYGVSSVSTSLEFLILTQSSFIGIGSGFYLMPLLVIIDTYFDKRKGLANALFMAGLPLGGLVMPLLYRYILDKYGLRGGLVLTSGVILNSVVFGALLRPFSFYTRKHDQKYDIGALLRLFSFCTRKHDQKYDRTIVIDDEKEAKPSDSLIKVNVESCPSDVTNDVIEIPCSSTSVTTNGQLYRERANTFSADNIQQSGQGAKHKQVQNSSLDKISDSFAVRYLSSSELATGPSALQWLETRSSKNVQAEFPTKNIPNTEITATDNRGSQNRGKLFLSQPLLNIDNEQQISRKRSSSFSTHPSNRKEVSTASAACELSTEHDKKHNTAIVLSMPTKWYKSIDFTLFKSIHFLLVLACLCFGSVAMGIAHIYVPLLAKDMNIEDQEIAIIVSVIYMGDFVGRITVGIIVNRAWMSPTRIVLISQLIVGIILQFMQYYRTFWHFILFAVVYGSTAGVVMALFPTMLSRTVGKERYKSALALFLLALAFVFGLTLPFLGYLRDIAGTFHSGFIYISCCCFMASLLLCIHDYTSRKNAAPYCCVN